MILRASGIVISVRKLQEGGALLKCFIEEEGIISGYHRPRNKYGSFPSYGDIGNLTWKVRLAEQLGYIEYESTQTIMQEVMYCKYKALILDSVLNLLVIALPEHIPYKHLFQQVVELLNYLKHETDIKKLAHAYIRFELLCFLQEIGFGMDLDKCVVTGSNQNLHYISPRSSAAVCEQVGQPYHDKLFHYPNFLFSEYPKWGEMLEGFKMGSYFLNKHLFHPHNKQMPHSRVMLQQVLMKAGL